MKILEQNIINTRAQYTIVADKDDMQKFRKLTANHLADRVKVPGFRQGKAPEEMVIKYADPKAVDDEFLNHAVNDLYNLSLQELKLRVIGDPKIDIVKFVPFTTLEFKVTAPIIKNIKLPDYKNLGVKIQKTEVNQELIDRNIKELRLRSATFKPVKRAAKNGDMVVIDFTGHDFTSKKKIDQASAKNYRLLLGEKTMIPGFEDKIVGLKNNESKTFTLTFPKDYQEKSFASKKVNFKVTVVEVNEVNLPKLDQEFAKSMGPFESIEQLQNEIKKQLKIELERQATIDYENQLLNKLAEKTEVELSDEIIEPEVTHIISNTKQTALHNGQTWDEYLKSINKTETEFQKDAKKAGIIRVKGGLAIGEIASLEGINITIEELDNSIDNLKKQYTDPQMQQELNDPNNRQELAMRLLTEKVLDYLQQNQVKST
jgi:trigger factor